jgi:hypothetical protein
MATDVREGIRVRRLYGEGLEKLVVVKMPVQCCRREMKAVFGDFEIRGAVINTFATLKPLKSFIKPQRISKHLPADASQDAAKCW